jgi:hypothetical protein
MSKKPKVERQPALEGMEEQRDEELSQLILKAEDVKQRRMALTTQEVEANRLVAARMRELDLEEYWDRETGAMAYVDAPAELKFKTKIQLASDGEKKAAKERKERQEKPISEGAMPKPEAGEGAAAEPQAPPEEEKPEKPRKSGRPAKGLDAVVV